ncbi:MAG: hypothetical protein AAB316_19715 [Bacteroidota bacterium]
MNFFQRIFNNGETSQTPAIRFGRFTDSYRSPEQEQAFDAAIETFEKRKYLDSCEAFFAYLFNEGENNVQVWKQGNRLRFELLQGSRKVTGFADHQKFYAEAKIAKAKSLQTSFMRRLLEANYDLKYSRFALTPANEIVLIFDSYTLDGSPYKLYQALKELATRADKHDDLLLDEFQSLEQIDLNVRRELPQAEKEIKHRFIVSQIQAVFQEMDAGSLNPDEYSAAMTYLLLALCYKLDYLTKPEGFTMEILERIQRCAYAQDEKSVAQKNRQLRLEFQKLLDRPQEKFFKEMYEVSSTFGVNPPVDHEKIALIIEQELPDMDWYFEHGHKKVALAIPTFIAGRCLFCFAPPAPDADFFHLLFQVLEGDYFRALGFKTYVNAAGVLDEKAIRQAIRDVVFKHKKTHPHLNPELKMLVFEGLPQFARSFLGMMKNQS